MDEHELGNLAQMAALQLDINVPIISAKLRGRVLELYLYNRDEPVEWVVPESVKLGGEGASERGGEFASGEGGTRGRGEGGSEKPKKKRGVK